MVRVKVTDIEWDTEVDGEITSPDLPTGMPELHLEVYTEEEWSADDVDGAVGDAVFDYLSDTYGYCVYAAQWDYL